MTIAAIRFNNPGNVSLPIQGYSGPGSIVGISGQSGYASFPTMADGLAAQAQRLANYVDVKGLNTIAAINTKYAEDPNWGANVSRLSGIGVNQPLDTGNSAQMNALQGAIIKQETGKDPSTFGFNSSTGVGSTDTTSTPVSTGGDGLGYASGGVETSAGSVYNGSDAQLLQDAQNGTVNLDFAGSGSGSGFGSTIDGASFGNGYPAAGDAQAGSFGLGGITSGGQSVGGAAGSAPSLAGATLDPGVSADSVTGGPVGYNAGGPVTANPDLVSATGKVADATKAGDKQITDGVKTAGQTVGQAITSSTQSALSWAGDSLLRFFVLIIGIALFAGALYYFGKPAIDNAVQKVPKIIPV